MRVNVVVLCFRAAKNASFSSFQFDNGTQNQKKARNTITVILSNALAVTSFVCRKRRVVGSFCMERRERIREATKNGFVHTSTQLTHFNLLLLLCKYVHSYTLRHTQLIPLSFSLISFLHFPSFFFIFTHPSSSFIPFSPSFYPFIQVGAIRPL